MALFGDEDESQALITEYEGSLDQHYSEGRCEGLHFTPHDTVKEARWAQYGGQQGWQKERLRRGLVPQSNQKKIKESAGRPPNIPTERVLTQDELEKRIITFTPPVAPARPRSNVRKRVKPVPTRQVVFHR